MKGFLQNLVVTNHHASQQELLDMASLLMSLSVSGNNLLHACWDDSVKPGEQLIADLNYLIAINTELAEVITDLVAQTQIQ